MCSTAPKLNTLSLANLFVVRKQRETVISSQLTNHINVLLINVKRARYLESMKHVFYLTSSLIIYDLRTRSSALTALIPSQMYCSAPYEIRRSAAYKIFRNWYRARYKWISARFYTRIEKRGSRVNKKRRRFHPQEISYNVTSIIYESGDYCWREKISHQPFLINP